MNVTDQWMLERMQQMAASMATVPQVGQNSESVKTEKGESFQDLVNKAKDQKVEEPKKADTTKKTETVQEKEPAQPVQKTQKTQKMVQIDPETGLKQIDVTPEEAALLVAGYAKLSPPMEDGTVWMVTVQDESGNPVLPLAVQEDTDVPFVNDSFVNTEGEWVLDEITPEFTQALEHLIQKTNDPRPVKDILNNLEQKLENVETEPEMKVVVQTPRTEQADDQEDTDDLDASVMTAGQPVFKEVKAAPVKVGETFQLDTEQADMDDQLAEIIQMADQQGLKQIEVKLSPENLGALTIKLTQSSDGTLQVVLHAVNTKTVNLLNQHLDNLHLALQGTNQNEVHVEVQRGENSQQAEQQFQQADPNGHNRQQQQQQRQQQEDSHSGDFLQKLRLGLFSLDEIL